MARKDSAGTWLRKRATAERSKLLTGDLGDVLAFGGALRNIRHDATERLPPEEVPLLP